MSIEARVQGVFRKVFRKPELVLEKTMNSNNIEGWNSLANINLIIGLEKEFAVKMKAGEVIRLKNVGELFQLVELKLSQKT